MLMRRMFVSLFLCAAILGASAGVVRADAPMGCVPASLKARLAEIRAKFGPVTVISTLRRGAQVRFSGRPSRHAACRAVDFKVGNKAAVYRWLDKVHNGGVGIYHGACSHIHIDDGERARWSRNYCG